MPTKPKFVINKIKNDNTQTNKPAKFPKMKELYLQLMDNKSKINPNTLNIPSQDIEQPNIEPVQDIEKSDYSRSSRSDYSRSSRSDYSKSSRSEYSRSSRSDKSSEYSRRSDKYSDYSRSSRSSRSSKLHDRLANLINDDKTDNNTNLPPTIEELQRGEDLSNNILPNMNNIEDEEDRKRELLFKFELLKKSYKGSEIPDYNIHTDYNTINNSYENTVRRLSVDSNVENYKTYLIGGCMGVEYLLGRFLKFDMKGFTQQQIINMSSYDKMLIELGEKSYVPKSKQWSVEARLFCLILFNAGMFVASKLLMKGTGSNLLDMMNSLTKNTTSSDSKKKMKPPNVNLDDLPS
jgi:hypothetical protein